MGFRVSPQVVSGLIVLAGAAGCGTVNGFAFRSFGFRKSSDHRPVSAEYVAARKELKKPQLMFLSHGRLMEDVGELARAKRSYDDVLADTPDNVDAMLGLARIEQLSGRTDEAERRFHEIYERFPDNARVMESLGLFYAEYKRWDEAIAMLKSAALTAPDQPTYRYHLGTTLAHAERFDEALKEFTRSVGAAEAHYNVGHILHEQGRGDEAERFFMQALVLKPSLREAEVLLANVRRERSERLTLAAGTHAPLPVRIDTVSSRLKISPVSNTVDEPLHSQRGDNPFHDTAGAVSRELPAVDWQPSPTAPQTPLATVPQPPLSDRYAGTPAGGTPTYQTQPGLTPQQLEQLRNQTEFAPE